LLFKDMRKRIYLDYAATTPCDKRVIEAMLPYFNERFGNTVSFHSFGREAKQAVDESRAKIAMAMGAKDEEIIFTSSATESNNQALKGIAFANKNRGKHIIISQIEHDCVLNSARWLKEQGFEIEALPVDKYGKVSAEALRAALRKDTILVSVMHANNEIGTIEDIAEIGAICRKRNVYFHTDASQTFGKIKIDVKEMNIDLLTSSSHKMYGPKGAGVLFVREGVNIDPLLHGGGHEFSLRSSTLNTAAIIGFARASVLCQEEMEEESVRLIGLRDRLIKGVLKSIPDSQLNGHPKERLPNNINFSFLFVEGEAMVARLDSYGIAASSASACSSPKLEPSHVLLACGLSPQQAHGSLRMSLGRWTTEEDIDYVLEILPKIVTELRRISPFKTANSGI